MSRSERLYRRERSRYRLRYRSHDYDDDDDDDDDDDYDYRPFAFELIMKSMEIWADSREQIKVDNVSALRRTGLDVRKVENQKALARNRAATLLAQIFVLDDFELISPSSRRGRLYLRRLRLLLRAPRFMTQVASSRPIFLSTRIATGELLTKAEAKTMAKATSPIAIETNTIAEATSPIAVETKPTETKPIAIENRPTAEETKPDAEEIKQGTEHTTLTDPRTKEVP
jgi:hypothetical protein